MKTTKLITVGLISLFTLGLNAQGKGHHSGNKEHKSDKGYKSNSKGENQKDYDSRYGKHKDNNDKGTYVVNNRNYKVFYHNNQKYYGNNGNYYKYYNKKYVRAFPPAGFKIAYLPTGYINVNVGNAGYFYHSGIYYSGIVNNYVVISPPIGAVIYTLPVGYTEVYRGGSLYFVFNGALYGQVNTGGRLGFQIVGWL